MQIQDSLSAFFCETNDSSERIKNVLLRIFLFINFF